jgi:hypothetical protein
MVTHVFGVRLERLAFLGAAAIGFLVPVSLFFSLGNDLAVHWIRHDPGMLVFPLTFLPWILLFLVRNITAFVAPWRPQYRAWLITSSALLLVFAVCMPKNVFFNFKDSNNHPCYVFADSKNACIDDERLRNILNNLADNPSANGGICFEKSNLSSVTEVSAECVRKYSEKWSVRTGSDRNISWEKLSVVAPLKLFVTYFAFLVGLTFVWHCVSFLWAGGAPPKIAKRATGILVLFLCWFPLEIYSYTYINFFDGKYQIVNNVPFIGAAIGVVLTAVILALAHFKQLSWTWLQMIASLAAAAFAGVAIQDSPQRIALLRAISEARRTHVLFIEGIVLALIIAIVVAAMGTDDHKK